MQSIPDDISPAEYVETRFEANALVNIWREFQSDNSPLLTEKLRIVLRGATLTSFKGQKTEPRDICRDHQRLAEIQKHLQGKLKPGITSFVLPPRTWRNELFYYSIRFFAPAPPKRIGFR